MKTKNPRQLRLDVEADDHRKVADVAWLRRTTQRSIIREALRQWADRNAEEAELAARTRAELEVAP